MLLNGLLAGNHCVGPYAGGPGRNQLKKHELVKGSRQFQAQLLPPFKGFFKINPAGHQVPEQALALQHRVLRHLQAVALQHAFLFPLFLNHIRHLFHCLQQFGRGNGL